MNTSLWLDLLNSDWRDYRGSGKCEDRLDDSRWLDAFLARWGIDLGKTSRQETAQAFRKLRNVVRRLADKYAARKKIVAEDWGALNSYLGRIPLVLRVRVAGRRIELAQVPIGGKLEAALARIAAAFVETVVHSDSSRIKVCQNKDCLWVFYDRSKNRSRRWCESTCGNLMKVRKFRQRRKGLLSGEKMRRHG